MIRITEDDLLRALKRCKGIAKQDLLSNDLIPQTDYRRAHAEARRETYTRLIELVEGKGIQDACVFAFSTYQSLPTLTSGEDADASTKGHIQALEMFFNVIGIDASQIETLHNGITDFSQLLSYNQQYPDELSSQILTQ